MVGATRLKTLREEAGKTQKDVAEALGITEDYVSMLERDLRTPGFGLAKKLADLYGVSVDVIYIVVEANKKFSDEHAATLDRTGTGGH